MFKPVLCLLVCSYSLVLGLVANAAPATATPMVHDAWVRATPPGVTTAAIYMVLHNPAATPVTLRQASSPLARQLELHTTTTDAQGVSRMAALTTGLLVPAGAHVALAPGGHHVMVYGLQAPLVSGQELPLRLEFDQGPAITTRVKIMPPDYWPATAPTPAHHHHH